MGVQVRGRGRPIDSECGNGAGMVAPTEYVKTAAVELKTSPNPHMHEMIGGFTF
jgi:hypothetical protein